MACAAGLVGRGTGRLATVVLYGGLAGAWAVAGAMIAARRPAERQGAFILRGSFIGAIAVLGAAVLWSQRVDHHLSGATVDLAGLALAVALALLPAAGMHILLTLPDGTCRIGRAVVAAGYGAGATIGFLIWLQRPVLPLWPVAIEAAVAAAIGLGGSNLRYRKASGIERQRMQWFGWAVAVGAEVTVLAVALRLLSGWPDSAAAVVVLATLPIPVALALGSSPRLINRVDILLAHTVSLAGLSAVVVSVYVVIVLGLGRTPTASAWPGSRIGLSTVSAKLPTRRSRPSAAGCREPSLSTNCCCRWPNPCARASFWPAPRYGQGRRVA